MLAPQQELASPTGRSFWEQHASVMPEQNAKTAAGQVASLVSSGALASTPYGKELPLTIEAGEKVRIRVLTRDKFLNHTSRSAYKRVTVHLESADANRLPPQHMPDPTEARPAQTSKPR